MKLKELKNGRLALRLAAVVFGIVGGENMDEGGGFGGSSGSFLVLGKQLHVFCQDGTCLKSFGMFEKVWQDPVFKMSWIPEQRLRLLMFVNNKNMELSSLKIECPRFLDPQIGLAHSLYIFQWTYRMGRSEHDPKHHRT